MVSTLVTSASISWTICIVLDASVLAINISSFSASKLTDCFTSCAKKGKYQNIVTVSMYFCTKIPIFLAWFNLRAVTGGFWAIWWISHTVSLTPVSHAWQNSISFWCYACLIAANIQHPIVNVNISMYQ